MSRLLSARLLSARVLGVPHRAPVIEVLSTPGAGMWNADGVSEVEMWCFGGGGGGGGHNPSGAGAGPGGGGGGGGLVYKPVVVVSGLVPYTIGEGGLGGTLGPGTN